MIKINIPISKYKWQLIVCVDVDIDDINNIIQCLHYLYCANYYIKDVVKSIYNGTNNAITISNLIIQRSLIVINKTSCDKEFVNSIVHECRHVQSHIATKYNLNEKDEDVAYLIGYIVSKVYDKLSS